MNRGYPMVAPLDAALALLLMMTAAFLLSFSAKPVTPTVETLGIYAVSMTWSSGSDDDVDLYVADPDGNVAYFSAQDVGLMHLENDDLGTAASGTYDNQGKLVVTKENSERTVIRGAIPGEYIVNVQMYDKAEKAPAVVTVRLWRLRGNDRPMASRTVKLQTNGQVDSVFRFTLDARGNISDINRLDKDIVTPTE